MEAKLITRQAAVTAILSDLKAEQNVETQLTLAEYLPEILQISWCNAEAFVTGRRIEEGRAVVDGTVRFDVLYRSEDGGLYAASQTAAWRKSAETDEKGQDPEALASAAVLRCSATPVGPRRFNLSADIGIKITVCGGAEKTFCTGVDEPDVAVRSEQCEIRSFLGTVGRQYAVSNDLEAPPTQRILCSRMDLTDVETRAVEGKLILKGNFRLRLLYSDPLSAAIPGEKTYLLPFNQIADCEWADEEAAVTTALSISSYALILRNEGSEEAPQPKLLLDTVVYLSACGGKAEQLSVVTDAYSKTCQADPTLQETALGTALSTTRRALTATAGIPTDERGLSHVIGCCAALPTVVCEQDLLTANGSVTAVAVDASDETVFLTAPLSAQTACPLSQCRPVCERAVVTGCSIETASGALGVEIAAEAELLCAETHSQKILTALSIDPSKPHAPPKCALVLCYAAPGENLWEIARHYHVSVESIRLENGIDSDAVDEPTMLIIPTV